MNGDPVFVIGDVNTTESFYRQAESIGIKRGSASNWKEISKRVDGLSEILHKEEFLIQLRLLADHFLLMRIGELDRTSVHTAMRDANDARTSSLASIANLKRHLGLRGNEKPADSGTYARYRHFLLTDEMRAALGRMLEDVEQVLCNPPVSLVPPDDGFPKKQIRFSQHGLVKTFEQLWALYSTKPIKNNRKAYSIARMFFPYAGCRPDGHEQSGEHSDTSDLFKQARLITKHLGPLTPVRRLSKDEIRELKRHYSALNPPNG